MHYTKFNIILLGFSVSLLAFPSCKKKKDIVDPPPTNTTAKGTIGFEFSNYAGANPLALNTGTYRTAGGEDITVSRFNYYISNIRVMKSDGTEYVEPESYHLVQTDVAGSKHFHLKDVPQGTYTGISFWIGVDSVRNVSGAQTGALDPVNGMFWSWSTGYIMAKLEGTSPQATTPGNTYTLHIGGFKGDNTGTRKVTLTFPQNMQLTGNSEGTIAMKADLLKWFEPNAITIASGATIMSPSTTSNKIADNYTKMFSITSVIVTTE